MVDDAEDARPSERQESSRERSGSSTRRGIRRRQRRTIRILGFVATVLGLSTLGLALTWGTLTAQLSSQRRLVGNLQEQVYERDDTIAGLQAELTELRSALAEAVLNRIPGLHALELERVIKVEQEYLYSALFTAVGAGDEQALEYHVVASNDSVSGGVLPAFTIKLFDDKGIQVGEAKQVDIERLERGERRSYAGVFPKTKTQPRYFLVQLGGAADALRARREAGDTERDKPDPMDDPQEAAAGRGEPAGDPGAGDDGPAQP